MSFTSTLQMDWSECLCIFCPNVTIEEKLNMTARAGGFVVEDKATRELSVVRISMLTRETGRYITFLERYGETFYNIQNSIHGMVKIINKPQRRVYEDKEFLVERYEYITLKEYQNLKAEKIHRELEPNYFNSCDYHRNDLRTLARIYIRNGITEYSETIRIMYDVAKFLEDFHAQKFAHLDLSIENIVTDGFCGKVIDFESCRKIEDDYTPINTLCSPMKTKYLPPEIDKRVRYRSRDHTGISLEGIDIWAFGICYFVLLFGDHPFCSSRYATEKNPDGICFKRLQQLEETGFKQFCYNRGLQDAVQWDRLDLWVDLMDNIFVVLKPKRNPTTGRWFWDNTRFSARQILDHLFFSECHVENNEKNKELTMKKTTLTIMTSANILNRQNIDEMDADATDVYTVDDEENNNNNDIRSANIYDMDADAIFIRDEHFHNIEAPNIDTDTTVPKQQTVEDNQNPTPLGTIWEDHESQEVHTDAIT
jgi:serine/threonine protein kinase